MNQEIPDGWNKVKFKELAKQKSVRIDNPGESGFEKYVGLEHLDSGELVVKRYGSTSDVTSTMKLFNKGDILFARRNTYLKRVSVAPFDGVCSGDIIVLESILDHIVEGFLPIFMQFEPFENRIIALSAGAFSKRIKWKQLAEEDVFVPSIEEQKKIAQVLWVIEENIEKNNYVLETLLSFKNALLSKLFTKGIDHNAFKLTDLGEISEKWDVVNLSKIAEIKYGLGQPPESDENGIPMIRATDIQRGSIILDKIVKINSNTIPKNKNPYLKRGDIIVVRSGAYTGDLALYDINLENAIAGYDLVVSPNKQEINPIFLSEYMLGNYVQRYFEMQSVRSAQPHLNSTQLGKTLVPKPLISEQNRIADIIININEMIIKIENHGNELKKLKQKLTNNFISGKLIIPKEVL